MSLGFTAASLGFTAPGLVPASASRSQLVMETKADLVALADELNPVLGFWDPLKLSDANLWGKGNEATIGWIRESEIKHGRIAMAGFIGYIVHANGIRTQGDQVVASIPTGLSPQATWDALPDIAKWQIVTFVGVLELWRENRWVLENEGEKHYMKGGTPGYFPTFDKLPHPVPFNLYDPWGTAGKRTDAEKARGRIVEINNGRLAMIGLFGFLSESAVPGSVPALGAFNILPYDGEVMAPFTQNAFAAGGVALF